MYNPITTFVIQHIVSVFQVKFHFGFLHTKILIALVWVIKCTVRKIIELRVLVGDKFWGVASSWHIKNVVFNIWLILCVIQTKPHCLKYRNFTWMKTHSFYKIFTPGNELKTWYHVEFVILIYWKCSKGDIYRTVQSDVIQGLMSDFVINFNYIHLINLVQRVI